MEGDEAGIAPAPPPPHPSFAGLVGRCLFEEGSLFQYERTRYLVDLWLADTCSLVGWGGVVLA